MPSTHLEKDKQEKLRPRHSIRGQNCSNLAEGQVEKRRNRLLNNLLTRIDDKATHGPWKKRENLLRRIRIFW